MELIIAEKASLARDIARALCGKPVSDKAPLPLSGNDIVVTAASGHLLELVDPEVYDPRLAQVSGAWSEADLPIYFPDWKKDIRHATDENGRKTSQIDAAARDRLEQIRQLMAKADTVTNAGDPDDEGQALVDEIITFLGWTGPVERLYVNDSLEKNIQRAYSQKKPNAECAGDGEAAYARAIADCVFGFSNSRLLSSRLRVSNVSVGRVQTPTLGLVVNRDRAIESHSDAMFYQIEASLREMTGTAPAAGSGSAGTTIAETAVGDTCSLFDLGELEQSGDESSVPPIVATLAPTSEFMEDYAEDGKHVTQRAPIEELAKNLKDENTCEMTFKTKTETTEPPKPYNITDLEADMNKRYGYTAAETLAYTQTLRDKYSAITYNRTSSSYLKMEHWNEAEQVLTLAMANAGISWDLDYTLKTKAFDDDKVSAHHGMIPTERTIDISRMTEAEANVYTAIVMRYAAQFLPPRTVLVCQGQSKTPQGTLKYRASRVESEGWKAVLAQANAATGETDDDATAEAAAAEAAEAQKPLIPDGTYTLLIESTTITEHKTTPPRPYTEATLLKDMASIARYVTDPELRAILKKKDEDDPDEHGGIGTSATRPSIIEALKRHKFIEEDGKKIISTSRGRAVYDLIPDDLKKADTTALWWIIQEDVRLGASHNAVAESVVEQFNNIKSWAYKDVQLPVALMNRKPRGPVIGKCPRCGEDVWAAEKIFVCSSIVSKKQEDGSWAEVAGCGWKLFRTVAGKKITDNQMAQVLSGKTPKAAGFKSRNGDTFEAKLSLDPVNDTRLKFTYEDKPAQS